MAVEVGDTLADNDSRCPGRAEGLALLRGLLTPGHSWLCRSLLHRAHLRELEKVYGDTK